MEKFNVIREIQELKNQLSYSKNIGFFFGAGTSTALGIPNIYDLTKEIEESLTDELKNNFRIIKNDLKIIISDQKINIEHILNQTRRIREITGEKEEKKYLEINGKSAKELDVNICKKIYEIISKKEVKADLQNTMKFLAWLNMQNRDFSKEIYTSNYDMLIERSLEKIQIPYFDGFVGSYEPFFLPESVDKFVKNSDLTKSWIRLWKIHGSLSWFWKKDDDTNTFKIVRIGKINNNKIHNEEIVIYPSREKYDSSRKQPFIAYFDRLKNYLSEGELCFIISGYSFSDQHINEIIFNSLRQNNRLFIIVFSYTDSSVENLYKLSSSFLNISAFGPNKAIINGELKEWIFTEDESENHDSYWDYDNGELTIGDFNKLVNFFINNSGKKETIEHIIKNDK
jgi:hypothetical protein